MSNPYFIFKKFTIRQDRAAMKVCSDACLFAAWVAAQLQHLQCETILDIGTGTGLLSLMLAQKSHAIIDAIDLDEHAFLQAKENFAASPWASRLHAMEADANLFRADHKYDLIICNPPFYQKELRSPNNSENLARHDTGLTLEELIKSISFNLSRSGIFAILLPWSQFENFEKLAHSHYLSSISRLDVRQTANHGYFRTIALFSAQPVDAMLKAEIAIKAGNIYTQEFISLLQDYYLYL